MNPRGYEEKQFEKEPIMVNKIRAVVSNHFVKETNDA
jgi:hypothetical protein